MCVYVMETHISGIWSPLMNRMNRLSDFKQHQRKAENFLKAGGCNWKVSRQSPGSLYICRFRNEEKHCRRLWPKKTQIQESKHMCSSLRLTEFNAVKNVGWRETSLSVYMYSVHLNLFVRCKVSFLFSLNYKTLQNSVTNLMSRNTLWANILSSIPHRTYMYYLRICGISLH